MHGVKRLFAWMIPRFDRSRYRCVAGEPAEEGPVRGDARRAGRRHQLSASSRKFDPATLTGLLKIIDRKQIDVLHLHGYGATTFGRLAGAMQRHADDPARAREPHRYALVPESGRPPARAVHRHRDCGLGEHGRVRRGARGCPARASEGRVPRALPLEEFGRHRDRPSEIAAARAAARHRAGRVCDRHHHPAARVEGQHVSRRRGAARRRASGRTRGSSWWGRGRFSRHSRRRRGRSDSAIGSSSSGSPQTWPATLSAFDLSVFPSLWEGTPLTVFEALAMGKAIVATDADGLLDVLVDGRDGAHRSDAQCGGARGGHRRADGSPGRAARLSAAAREAGQQYGIDAFVRKMERLYTMLADVSRRTKRQGILQQDLSFLETAGDGDEDHVTRRDRCAWVRASPPPRSCSRSTADSL